MFRKLAGYFVRGLVVFVPGALTVFAVAWVFTRLDAVLRSVLQIEIPGLGLAVTVVFITVVGFIASHVAGRRLFRLIDAVFDRVPLIRLVYSSTRDFVHAFAGEKRSFDRPVVVDLTPNGPRTLGFVTRDDLASLGLAGEVAVYVPQSYNFAGSLLIFPRERVRALNLDASAAMAFIVSGGVADPTK